MMLILMVWRGRERRGGEERQIFLGERRKRAERDVFFRAKSDETWGRKKFDERKSRGKPAPSKPSQSPRKPLANPPPPPPCNAPSSSSRPCCTSRGASPSSSPP